MNGDALIALTVGFPPLAGLLCYALNNKAARRIIVALTAVVLIGSSILLFQGGGFSYEPAPIFESVILVLDLALLVYFLYAGLKSNNLLVIGLAVLQLIPVAYFEFGLGGMAVEPMIVVNQLSLVMSLIIGIVGSLIVVYALSYMDEHEHHLHIEKSKQPRFFFFMLLLLGAMYGLVFSNSLYWVYFFWEVTTLCSYELIRHDGTDIAVKNSLTALWMNLLGGVGFVAAIYLAYTFVGTLSIEALISSNLTRPSLLLFAALAFAAFTKSAQFPFNKWLQGAMVAPTPVSALLHSSTMVNAGIFLILRFAPAFSGTALSFGIALVGAFTFMITAVLALNERLSKGILAYSTIGNLGLIILCVGISTQQNPLGYVAALTLLIFHSVSKGLLFLCAGVVENRVHTRVIEDWEGLLAKLPTTTIIMIVGMLSMFLPPFGMLIGKWVAIDAIITSSTLGFLIIIVLVLIGSAATTLYYAKWLGHMLVLPQSGKKLGEEQLPLPYSISLLSLLTLGIVMGAGVSMVIGSIVLPALPAGYFAFVSTGTLSFSTGIGTFLTYPFWVGAIAIFVVGWIIATKKGGIVKPPYVSGENVLDNPDAFETTADTQVPMQVSALFMDNEFSQSNVLSYGAVAGALIVMIMFITVVL
jgi:ech hydrogenase subunit A